MNLKDKLNAVDMEEENGVFKPASNRGRNTIDSSKPVGTINVEKNRSYMNNPAVQKIKNKYDNRPNVIAQKVGNFFGMTPGQIKRNGKKIVLGTVVVVIFVSGTLYYLIDEILNGDKAKGHLNTENATKYERIVNSDGTEELVPVDQIDKSGVSKLP